MGLGALQNMLTRTRTAGNNGSGHRTEQIGELNLGSMLGSTGGQVMGIGLEAGALGVCFVGWYRSWLPVCVWLTLGIIHICIFDLATPFSLV